MSALTSLAIAPEARSRPGLQPAPCLACRATAPLQLFRGKAHMHRGEERFSWVECGVCGLVYLDPRVPEADIGRFYEDYLPHRGAAAWGRWSWVVAASQSMLDRARVRTVRRISAPGPGRAALDVGCGRPTFLDRLQRVSGARAVGTDFDPSGWRRDPERWTRLELHHGELESLPLCGPFACITMWHALEHLYQPLGTLRHLRSIAGSGATLVVEVPDYDSVTRARYGADWAGYHTPRHTAAYTPVTLRDVLERAGWRVVHQYQWGTLDPWLLIWLSEQERQGRSFDGSLQARFLPFLLGKLMALPLTLRQHSRPLGIQTAIAVA